MKIVDLQINHLTTPLGHTLDDPRLSWRYDGLEPGDGTKTAQARITVARTREDLLAATGGDDTADTDEADGDRGQAEQTGRATPGSTDNSASDADAADALLYDSGWQTGLDPRSTPLGLTLEWRCRYWWRVQVRTDTGRLVSSQPTWFETGVMEDEWVADWITTGQDDPQQSRHPVFSRRLALQQDADQIDRARVYACGLGLMRLFVDGRPVDADHGQGRLDPGDFDTDAWLQTMTYDITDALKKRTGHEQSHETRTGHARGHAANGGLSPETDPVLGSLDDIPTADSPDDGSADADQHDGYQPVISLLLGNGWYRGRVLTDPAPDPRERPWDLIAEVHIWYKDGSHQVIGTNHNWQVTRSHITSSSIYDGESRDDTLPDVPAVDAVVDQHNHALLYDRLSPAVTVCEELPVVRSLTSPSGKRIFDLGQNFAGVFRLTSRLPEGARLSLRFAEHLEDGELDTRTLRTARQRYDYVSDGQEKRIEPLFTYYGYRYVQVEATAADGTDLTAVINPEDFTGLALTSRMGRVGQVTTGNDRVNRFLRNVEWSRRSNFMDTPTDSPQRDERLGRTGDAQVFAPTALYGSDATAFYRKYLFDMRAEQERDHGMVPVIIPARGDRLSRLASAGWSDAAVLLPWDLYRFTGDETLLAQSYPLMKDWVDWVARTDAAGAAGAKNTAGTAGGNNAAGAGSAANNAAGANPADPDGPKAWRSHFHFGDWLALDGAPGAAGVRGATPVGLIADAYWYLSATLLSRAARVLRNQTDEGAYAAMAQQVRARLLRDFFDADGVCTARTQTGAILALALGLGDRDGNAALLRRLLEKSDGRLTTGFIGTGLLVEALSRADMDGTFLDLLLDERYPGPMAAVGLGATSIWERWDSLRPDGRLRDDPSDPLGSMNSLNHCWPGCVAEWFPRRGAGFDGAPAHPRLVPHISRRLGSLSADYRAPGGVWHLAWKIGDGDKIHVEVIVPFDATADLLLPCSGEETPRRLGPGRHVYDYEAATSVPR